MNHIIPINEFHPGARAIRESIEYWIERGDEEGISRETSIQAIGAWLDHLKGKEVGRAAERGSELARAIRNIGKCIDTIEDDGYPLRWTIEVLEEVYSESL